MSSKEGANHPAPPAGTSGGEHDEVIDLTSDRRWATVWGKAAARADTARGWGEGRDSALVLRRLESAYELVCRADKLCPSGDISAVCIKLGKACVNHGGSEGRLEEIRKNV